MKTDHPVAERLWAVLRPDDEEVLELHTCHRGEQACSRVATRLGVECGPFFASWLPGSRRAEEEGEGFELIAVDVTGRVSADASLSEVFNVLNQDIEEFELERLTARMMS